jgi:hypothetical protein
LFKNKQHHQTQQGHPSKKQQLNTSKDSRGFFWKFNDHRTKRERDKDITDIQTILYHYLELLDLEEYGRYIDVLDLYDTDDADNYQSLVGARIAGRKIRDMLAKAPEINQRVKLILLLRLDRLWQAIRDGMNDDQV